MKRILGLFLMASLGSVAGLGAGCDKPSEDSCRAALRNIQKLIGTENLVTNDQARFESDVRHCRGGSKKASVECATKATTLAELEACKFITPAALEKIKAGTVTTPSPAPTPSPTPTPTPSPAPSPSPTPTPSPTPSPSPAPTPAPAAGSAAPAAGSAAPH